MLKYILISGLIFFISMLAFVALSGYSNRATNDEKVLIVLGSSLQRDGSVGGILAARLDTAACAWRQNPDIIIIVSGGVSAKGPEPEAAAMRRYLIEHHNIPQVQIYIEDHSVSTQQNFLYSKQLMMQHRIDTAQPIAFVTNTFHAWRARFFARQAGFANMRCLPAPTPPLYLLIAYFREVFAVLFTWVFRRGI